MADTYFTSVRESAVAAGKRHLSVFNATGSGKTMVVYKIMAAGTPTAAVTGAKVTLAALRITSEPSDGSLLTAPMFAKAKTANANVPAQITARTGATTGTVETGQIAFGVVSVSGEETASDAGAMIYEAPLDGSQQIEFPEGQGFQVVQGTLAAAGNVSIVAVIGLI